MERTIDSLRAKVNHRLTELQWFYSPYSFADSVVTDLNLAHTKEINKKPLLVLDLNIFSRLIEVAINGKTNQGSTQDIAILMSWSILNDVNIWPYLAINEKAQCHNNDLLGQNNNEVFDKIYKEIPMTNWLALALGLEKENKTLIKFSYNAIADKVVFNETSVDYLSNYAAMLHFAVIQRTADNPIDKFFAFFDWYFRTLKVSRYTIVYVVNLLLGTQGYLMPRNVNSEDFSRVVKGCQNQARDLSYITLLSPDRWYNTDWEPIFVTDDHQLGRIFAKGCFLSIDAAVREFETNIKTRKKQVSEWTNQLLRSHIEVQSENYACYCMNVMLDEWRTLKTIFEQDITETAKY